ncbi:hypothetical protein [Gilvimarinus sp. 1_MG-2023]|uniref:hypothetical protein n=1 Tax=Gilvimarinus sp. 1_MG-2023 TaxID=3062638 RepID=UPI0026E12709|nr:hypothetical protein [Gilvimarinus sp. 1_MG-2023]MDO6745616.1 hypothetical protein [Gilvimarinus sp. 1_MG-2023]
MRSYLVFFFLSLSVVASAQTDPCEQASDKITCIVNKIKYEKGEIEALLENLDRPGPQGPQGLMGEVGEVGDDGVQGLSQTLFYGSVVERHDELLALMGDSSNEGTVLGDELYVRRKLAPINNVGSTLVSEFQRARLRVSNHNRNPSDVITKLPYGEVTEIDGITYYIYEGLAFPRADNSSSVVAGPSRAGYFFNAENGDVFHAWAETSGSGGDLFENVFVDPVVNPGQSYPVEPLCKALPGIPVCSTRMGSRVYSDTILLTYTDIDTPIDVDFDEYLDEPEELPGLYDVPIRVVSLKDHASYLLGAEPENPIFQRAVSRTLDLLEEDELKIIESLDEARSSFVIDYAAYSGIPDFAEEAANIDTSFTKSIELVQVLAQNNPHARIVLETLALESPLMRYLLVCNLIDIYLEYRDGSLFGLSETEIYHLELFEDGLARFVRSYTVKMRDISKKLLAADMRTRASLHNVLALPFGPYVDSARDLLYADAVIKQPQVYRELYDALFVNDADLETVAVISAAVSTTTGVNPTLLLEQQLEGTIRRVVDKAIKKVAAKGAKVLVRVLKVGGNSNVVAKIITTSIEIAIEGGLQASENSKQRDAFYALMEAASQLPDFDRWTDEDIANAAQDWLTIGIDVN